MESNGQDPSATAPILPKQILMSNESTSRLKIWRVRIMLPVVVMLYFFGYIVSVIVINPIVYDRIAAEYPQINTSSRHPCTNHMDNTTNNSKTIQIQDEIQKRVSTFELHLNLATFTVAVIPVLCLGPLSDRYGRKIGFICPIIGTALKQFLYCLIVGLDLRLDFMFLGNILEALGGSFATMLMAMFSTISDVTVPGKGRSLGITLMEGLQTITASLSQVSMSRWLKTSYLYPLIFAGTLECLAFVFALAALPETLPESAETAYRNYPYFHSENPLRAAFSTGISRVKNTFTLYVWDAKGRLAKRRICLAVFLCTIAVNFSKHGVQTLYLMKYPMCWSNLKVMVFSGVQLAVNWVVIWLLLIVLQRLLNMKDRHVAILGCVSSFVACVFMSLATTDVMVYEVAALGVMTRSIIPMVRSIISSVVDNSDQGAVFAGMGCLETLGAGLFGIVANRIYFATLSNFAGSVFLVFAGCMLLAIILLVILNILFARDESSVPDRRVNSDDN